MFGRWLGQQLKAQRLSQRQFAELAGVSKSAVGAWINGDRVPDPDSCKLIASALDIGWDEVLTRAEHRANTGEFPIDDPRQRVIDLVSTLDPSDSTVRFWLDSLPPTIEKLRKLDPAR